jgi:hypothetical protein
MNLQKRHSGQCLQGNSQSLKTVGGVNGTAVLDSTVVATEIFTKQIVVKDDSKVNLVKAKIFNKIIPQSRDKHIQDMSSKKSLIKEDIHFLKESVQDLIGENIGRNI